MKARLALITISTLSLLRTVFGPNAIESRIFGVLGWLVGLAATFFLWQKDSSAFFADSSGRR